MRVGYWVLFAICGVVAIIFTQASAAPIYIAQGDPAKIPVQNYDGTCWYFGYGSNQSFYDIPSVHDGNMTYCEPTSDLTSTMNGIYDVIYTYPYTVNHKTLKDVYMKNGVLMSILASTRSINENGKQSDTVEKDMQGMVAADNIDGMENYRVIVNQPYLTIDRIEGVAIQSERISGSTNLQNGTIVNIKVDELRQYALHNDVNYSFTTTVLRNDIEQTGKWTKDMPLPLNDMPAGWHDADIYAQGVHGHVRFQVSSWWTPVPTPTQYTNYFSNGSIAPVTVTVTIILPTPTPEIQYIQLTPEPTPTYTDALGGEIDSPPSNISSLIPTGVVCMIVLAAIALMGMKKK